MFGTCSMFNNSNKQQSGQKEANKMLLRLATTNNVSNETYNTTIDRKMKS